MPAARSGASRPLSVGASASVRLGMRAARVPSSIICTVAAASSGATRAEGARIHELQGVSRRMAYQFPNARDSGAIDDTGRSIRPLVRFPGPNALAARRAAVGRAVCDGVRICYRKILIARGLTRCFVR